MYERLKKIGLLTKRYFVEDTWDKKKHMFSVEPEGHSQLLRKGNSTSCLCKVCQYTILRLAIVLFIATLIFPVFYHSLTFSCSFHCQQNQSRKFKGCLISVNNQSENSTVISLSANSSCTSCVCLRSQWCVLPSGWSVFTLKAITGTVVFALGCCRRLR